MDPIELIHSTPELKAVFSKFYKENTSNFAPYHNLWHTLCMVKNCYEGAKHEGLSDQETTDLLIAALIHDFRHSQGRLEDRKNVFNAIFFGEILFEDTDVFKDSEDFKQRIARIVKATEYPYVIPAEELDLQQQIIRDADLLQSLESTWFTHTTIGLSQELKIDLDKFIPMQIDFINNAQFNTSWGKELFEKNKESHILKVKMLKDIMGVPVTYIKKEKQEKEREQAMKDRIRGLFIKYPVTSFEEHIRKIEEQGYEVHASSDSAQVWKKTDGEHSATDLIIDADFHDTYEENVVEMIDAFYNGG